MDYLPNPTEVKNIALDMSNNETPIELKSEDDKPPSVGAFKLSGNDRYGQLTYIRIYQGHVTKGDTIVNTTTGKKVNVGRLVRMHADETRTSLKPAAGRHRRSVRHRRRFGHDIHGRLAHLQHDLDARS